MAQDYTEYVYILPDGSKRYEMVGEMSDVMAFKKLHGAVKYMPLAKYEKLYPSEKPA